jgi:hydroxymethylglutaryl-CoA lyase
LKAAYDAGCRKFDGAFGGFGGCPMAKDELVGNMPTEIILELFREYSSHFHFDTFNQNETLLLSQQTMNAH